MASFRLPRLSRAQWATAVLFVIIDFGHSIIISMLAPFYPAEAERKGLSASEYGFVFGIYELTVFVVSPLIGANLNRLGGVKTAIHASILAEGVTCAVYGLLVFVDGAKEFLALSIMLRIVEAIGHAVFMISSFSMLTLMFPGILASMFAVCETSWALGMILGPTISGALYQIGGFVLPFAVTGGLLFLSGLVSFCTLPKPPEKSDMAEESPSTFKALKMPRVLLALYSLACCTLSMGFIQTILEPHVREFDLTPIQTSGMFIIFGAGFGISAPVWGIVCDRRSPQVITLIGSLGMIVSMSLLGPLPFLPVDKSMASVSAALAIQGVSFGAELISAFSCLNKTAIANGFPDSASTHSLVSGLYASVGGLGVFLGQISSGLLLDAVGFVHATYLVLGSQAAVAVMVAVGEVVRRSRSGYAATGDLVHFALAEDNSPVVRASKINHIVTG